MRGKDNQLGDSSNDLRITPAYAGKRGRCCSDRLRCWDHPRVCGEKSMPIVVLFFLLGSPPRMQGKVIVPSMSAGYLRITPACAGKSRGMQISTTFFKDHPRVCGEKYWIGSPVMGLTGSPPRMRGKAAHR